jgi:hypothetical protein
LHRPIFNQTPESKEKTISALALLVPRLGADDHYPPLPADDLAIPADFLD